MWTDTSCLESFVGTQICLNPSPVTCQNNGVIGVPAGFYQACWGANECDLFSFDNINTYVVSPPINLSNESCVNLTWTESARFLNGETLSNLGPYVQYNVDGGETWNNPSSAIGYPDVSVNYGGEYVVNGLATFALERGIPLIGEEGNNDVRVRFGFDGDFYYYCSIRDKQVHNF